MSEYEDDALIVASESAEQYELEILRAEVETLRRRDRRTRRKLATDVATAGAFAGAVGMFCIDAGVGFAFTAGLMCMIAGVFGLIKIVNRDDR